MAAYIRHRVQASDTLRGLAVIWLGAHQRWTDIAALNNLTPDQYDLAGVTEILLPVEASSQSPDGDPFLRDIATRSRAIVITDTGDLGLVGGLANLVASLVRALTTDVGSLIAHPDYGFNTAAVVGQPRSKLMLRSVSLEAERVIRRDPRVADVKRVRTIFKDRTVTILASIQPVGTRDTIELVAERNAA